MLFIFSLFLNIRLKKWFCFEYKKNGFCELNIKVDHFITIRFLQILKNYSL